LHCKETNNRSAELLSDTDEGGTASSSKRASTFLKTTSSRMNDKAQLDKNKEITNEEDPWW
jgi:hypothetical protein